MSASTFTDTQIKNLSKDMLRTWEAIISPLAKTEDRLFVLKQKITTYRDEPVTSMYHNSRFNSVCLEIEGSISAELALIFAVFLVIKETQSWCDDVLGDQAAYDEEQVNVASLNTQALNKYKAICKQLMDTYADKYNVTYS